MNKRVLILAYDFPPRGATSVFRVAKFARYLPEFGWQPVVVTATVRGGMRDEALLQQLPPDLDVIHVDNPFAPSAAAPSPHSARPSFTARLRGQLRRLFIPDAQMLWVPAAVQAATERLHQGDIAALFSTAPPYSVHMAALLLKRRFPALPWLMDLRDIWSENPAITDVPTYKLQRACERLCLHAADHVTTATDGQRELIMRAFHYSAARISTITNGYDPLDVPPEQSEIEPHTALRIVHAGSIIGNRAAAARGLFDALHELVAQGITADDLQLRLIGVHDPRIYAWAAPFVQHKIVQLAPFVPYAEAYAAMRAADALLLLTSDDREGRLSHPNKLFEYFAVGKPVLALTPEQGDVARLLREAGASVALEPAAADRIAHTLQRMIEQVRAGALPGGGHDPQRFARFERRELTRQLAARLDALTA